MKRLSIALLALLFACSGGDQDRTRAVQDDIGTAMFLVADEDADVAEQLAAAGVDLASLQQGAADKSAENEEAEAAKDEDNGDNGMANAFGNLGGSPSFGFRPTTFKSPTIGSTMSTPALGSMPQFGLARFGSVFTKPSFVVTEGQVSAALENICLSDYVSAEQFPDGATVTCKKVSYTVGGQVNISMEVKGDKIEMDVNGQKCTVSASELATIMANPTGQNPCGGSANNDEEE
ncbi:MAG: hypothetical protein A2284_05760 [Deltaproteobacteria bacterium RIFOXYA12_FULL_61_11]|nr:MAG: hypothetical protein A2284_05760 [Deltaproteobacteria bacterium RIFOXYA12_FULL_61_11]